MPLSIHQGLGILALAGGLALGPSDLPNPAGPAKARRAEALRYDNTSSLIRPLGGTQWSATLSPDGKTIVTGHGEVQGKGEVRIWDLATGKVKQALPMPGGVRAVSFSPDGKVLVSSCFDGGVRFHDPKTFAVFAVGDEASGGHKGTGSAGGVNGICFFKGSALLATAGFDNTIRIWDVSAIIAKRKAGEITRVPPVAILEGHTQRVLSVSGTADGRTLFSGSQDHSCRLWDVPDPLPKIGEKPVVVAKERLSLGGHGTGVEGIAISPDGSRVVTGAWGGGLLVRSADGTRTDLSLNLPTGVICATFSRDGKYFAVGTGNRKNGGPWEVYVWETASLNQLAARNDFPDGVMSLEFTPDGKTLVVAEGNQTVHLWPWSAPKDEQTLTPTAKGFSPQPLLAGAVSPDGKYLLFSGETPSAFVYDRAEEKIVAELAGHADVVAAMAFSPDGKTLATASYDKCIKLWDTSSWKERRTLSGHTGWVFAVSFSPDGRTLASGSYDKTVRLWNVASGEARAVWREHTGGVRSVAFSPDGKRLISGGSDRVLRLWDVAKGEVVLALKGHKDAVRSVAFAPDGKSVASGSEDRSVKLWDAAAGKEIHSFSKLPDLVTMVRFSPHGRTLLAATYQGEVLILDPVSRRTRQTLTGHTDAVSSVVFADDGSRIVAVSFDRTIRQWPAVRVVVAPALQTVADDFGVVTCLAVAPNGSLAVFGSMDGTIMCQNLNTGTLQRYPLQHPDGVIHLAVSNDGRILSIGKDHALVVGSLRGSETWKGTGVFAVFTPDGKQVAIAEGKDIVFRDALTGKEIRRFADGHEGDVLRFDISRDGTKMISAGQDTRVRLWDMASGKKLQQTPPFGSESTINHVVFSPDGARFAVAAFGPEQPPPDSMDFNFRPVRDVRVYRTPKGDAAFGANPMSFQPVMGGLPLPGLHWAANGLALVLTSADGTVRVRELGANGSNERQRFQAHESAVLASASSEKAGLLMTSGEDLAVRRWRLPGLESGPGLARLTAPGLTRVWTALPSPNGQYIVSAGEGDKTFRVYSGAPSSSPVEPDNHPAVLALAFSPDNRFLLTGHTGGLVVVRNASTGEPIRTLTGLTRQVSSLAFAEKGAALVGVGGNPNNGKEPGEAVVWDFASGKVRHKLEAPANQTMIAIHPQGRLVAIAAADGKVRVSDIVTGKLLKTFGAGGPGLKVVAYDATGARLAAGGLDRLVRIWNTETGAEVRSISTDQLQPASALFSPDGKEIVISCWPESNQRDPNVPYPSNSLTLQPTIRAYSLADPAASPRSFAAHQAAALGLAFMPDGKTLIAAGGDKAGHGTLRVFDYASGRLLGYLNGHRHWAQSLAVSPDGTKIASTSWSLAATGELRLWDPRGFRTIAEVRVPDEQRYLSCGDIGLEGKLLVLGGWGGSLTAWDMTDPAKPLLRRTLRGHTAGLRSLAFDAQGRRFVSADEAGTVKVWDATTLELLLSFQASASPIYRARFSPDGARLVTVGGDWRAQARSEIRFWDTKTGAEVDRLPDQPREVWDVVFLDGGKRLATLPAFSGSPDDAQVKIWDVAKKVVVQTLLPPGSFSNGRCLGVSPDGKHLAIGSNTGPVKVFDTSTWQEVLDLPGLVNTAFQVSFTRDGNKLLIASGEGAAILVRLAK